MKGDWKFHSVACRFHRRIRRTKGIPNVELHYGTCWRTNCNDFLPHYEIGQNLEINRSNNIFKLDPPNERDSMKIKIEDECSRLDVRQKLNFTVAWSACFVVLIETLIYDKYSAKIRVSIIYNLRKIPNEIV